MPEKICLICGAGVPPCSPDSILRKLPEAFVIAADGGYDYLKSLHIVPDVFIGDCDSVLSDTTIKAKHTIRLEKEKDDTDMFAAVKVGLNEGCDSFYIYGGCGGRLDHFLANLQTIAFLSESGKRGFLFSEDTVITAISGGDSLHYDKECTGFISVFSYSEQSKDVTLQGLKYTLTNGTLTNTFPLGVSNEFTGKPAYITIGTGTLLVTSAYLPKES